MSRVISRAENWEKVYEAFQQVNFAAWDAETIKESLIDYLKLYFPEDFNDFIESSEFIALLETFAYITELVAYRFDMNAHENFISTAERKESILRLAKLLSYNANRNIPARGLVKLTSVSTTQTVYDSNGNDLSNTIIRWNDPNNDNWKEQFILIMNQVLDQQFGVVSPSDRVQIQDVVFERYKLVNNPLKTNTLPYTITVSNDILPMELVSADINTYGPTETRPEKNLNLGILYLNDGLGDSSENTGFFMYTKQGRISRTVVSFDGITPNQIHDVLINNSNETDIFINNINPDTNEILEDPTALNGTVRVGEWERVDTVGGQNVIFTELTNRNRYEIETLDGDNFRVIFGDGKFANIPSGTFEIWSRESTNTETPIPTTAINNVTSSFSYLDAESKSQNFNFSISLLTPIQNSAPTEDIEHIRRIAPAVYYTQDRMVNNRDYNEYMLQDNTILKLRAVNRTFSGDSKYIPWHDPREYYDNVKIFGDDGVIYFENKDDVEQSCSMIYFSVLPEEAAPAHTQLIAALIDNHLQPLLSSGAFFTRFVIEDIMPAAIRTTFTTTERAIIEGLLLNAINNRPTTKYFNFNTVGDVWEEDPTGTDYWFSITSLSGNNWSMCYNSLRLVFHSDETRFWNVNDGSVITTDTLNTNLDTIVVLKANVSAQGSFLWQNYNYDVLGQKVIDTGNNLGLIDINDLYILPEDSDGDGFPDDPALSYLVQPDPPQLNYAADYVYFNRDTLTDPWVFQSETSLPAPYLAWEEDQQANPNREDQLWKREMGKEGINFAWLHRTPRYHLIDPASSNIIDMFIITRGYAKNIRLWLSGYLVDQPEPPTPFQLRGDYEKLLKNKMISDTVILHPGNIKVLFGSKAIPEFQATIKVIRSTDRSLSNTQIKTAIVDSVIAFFDINLWEFGETFYFSELSAYIHASLPTALDSVVLVPTLSTNEFGDLYQVLCREDEIFQVDFTVDQVQIIESLTPQTLRQYN